MNLAFRLRKKGAKVDFEMTAKRLKKAMENANKLGAKKVIIVGENERVSNKIRLKDMMTGIEEDIE